MIFGSGYYLVDSENTTQNTYEKNSYIYGVLTSLREKISSLNGLWGFISLIIIVLGGIYTGIATPTESAAVGALGAFILALPILIKEPKKLVESLIETSVTTSMIFIIIVGASLFTMFLSIANIPATLTELRGSKSCVDSTLH